MPNPSQLKALLKDAAIVVCMSALLIFAVEGIAGFILLAINLKNVRIPAERLHTEHDEVLGWINKRNVHIQDMYGPGVYLKTNSQRFRKNRDVKPGLPASTTRWICCGDSFTFGYGVDNDHTWCSILETSIPGLETVNMGQGGYGLDQFYLWYMRDGIQLQHDTLIVAFITEDIPRMALEKFMNYPRPNVSVKGSEIIQNNVPVPRPGFFATYLPRYYPFVAGLNTVNVATQILKRLNKNDQTSKHTLSQPELLELTLSIFTALNDYNKKLKRTVFFVHLPVEGDFEESPQTDRFRAFLKRQARLNSWYYIDLIDDLRTLTPAVVTRLFIQKDIKDYSYSRGHYTKSGNQYIADLVADNIQHHLMQSSRQKSMDATRMEINLDPEVSANME